MWRGSHFRIGGSGISFAAARRLDRPPILRLAVPRLAIYPVLVTLAFALNDYAASNVSLEALPRPLVVAAVATIAVQLVLSAILRDKDRAAYLTLMIQFALFGLAVVSLILAIWLLAAVVVAFRRRRGLRLIPWLRATRVLNAVAILMLVQVVATSWLNGALIFGRSTWSVPRGQAASDAPDVYLIMLDGYPRADTLATSYDYDNQPWLSSMERLGFSVATRSHSNYDVTVLTLASMFNGAQIPTLIPSPPDSRAAQFRALTRIINQGTDLQRFRHAGYEIVSVPSEYFEGTVVDADRNLDTGELSSFEMQLLQTGAMTTAFGDLEKTWLPNEHRQRIYREFDTLLGLASERGRGPKIVFSHFLAPHMPISFNADGSAAKGLSCFPRRCNLFTYGDGYGSEVIGPLRDQITWLNGKVEETVRAIQDRSATPPVIVIFSDHGTRFWSDNRPEMFHSLLLAATPGHPGLFPDDASPVNLLSRLLNAYTTIQVPLSSEEDYWLDTREVERKGLLGPLRAVTSEDQLEG